MSIDIAQVVRRAWDWATAAFRRRPTRPRTLRLRQHLDMPAREALHAHELVVVGPADHPKWLTFPCPCGCGEPLLLSLNPSRRPRWSVTADARGRPSVWPSVRRTDGCLSHFWIRAGQVEWCADTGHLARVNLDG